MQQTIVDDLLVADRRGIAIYHGFTGKLNQAWDAYLNKFVCHEWMRLLTG
jgi:hypothetical protein